MKANGAGLAGRLAVLALWAACGAAVAQESNRAAGNVRALPDIATLERFAASARAGAPGVEPQSVTLRLATLSVPGRTPFAVPARGFYIAELVAGSVTTTIDGQDSVHEPGDVWAVAAGQGMQVLARGRTEHVLIQVLELTPAHP